MKLETILTKRQVEMFMLLAQGYSQQEIAEKLNVSAMSVSKVIHKVYDKLEARNAVEAVREALLHGLLSVEDLPKSPSEPFVDSRENVYQAMLECLESFVHFVHYPQTRDEDELRGEIKQMEWLIERAHKLKETE